MPAVAHSFLYDVFLSHNSKDKMLVEEIASELESKYPIKVFLDKWHIMAGETWQEALEDALYKSRDIAVFISSNGLGPWHNEEFRSALEEILNDRKERLIIPILINKSEIKDIPRFLKRRKFIDIRNTSNLEKSIGDLANSIRRIRYQERKNSQQPKQEKWQIKLEGTLDDLDKDTMSKIKELLRIFSGDSKLEIERFTAGSIIVHVISTKSAKNKILKLIRNKDIKYISELKILGVSFSNFRDPETINSISKSDNDSPKNLLDKKDATKTPLSEPIMEKKRENFFELFNIKIKSIENVFRGLFKTEEMESTKIDTEKLINEISKMSVKEIEKLLNILNETPKEEVKKILNETPKEEVKKILNETPKEEMERVFRKIVKEFNEKAIDGQNFLLKNM